MVSRLPLTVREYASSDSRALGTLQPGAVVALTCKVVGEKVDGNDRWYRLGAGKKGYVAARYVDNLSAVPWC
ncbi:SH3 domain-containing protein [Actinacidiphila yeochonensis]|uniref:SH3 domain-containing protein n=1 Tax=Actinacidiphila yeochonensis TaxID=89050 RepID=UPI00068DA3BB|nr:SH3 domain-containing protein [Actinacidiphila yeochonensis]